MHVKPLDGWLPIQIWEHIIVHEEVLPGDEEDCPTKFYAFTRKDADLLIKELIDSPEVHVDLLIISVPGNRVRYWQM